MNTSLYRLLLRWAVWIACISATLYQILKFSFHFYILEQRMSEVEETIGTKDEETDEDNS